MLRFCITSGKYFIRDAKLLAEQRQGGTD